MAALAGAPLLICVPLLCFGLKVSSYQVVLSTAGYELIQKCSNLYGKQYLSPNYFLNREMPAIAESMLPC